MGSSSGGTKPMLGCCSGCWTPNPFCRLRLGRWLKSPAGWGLGASRANWGKASRMDCGKRRPLSRCWKERVVVLSCDRGDARPR